MSYLYYIGPVASDPQFLDKRTRLLEITKICQLNTFFPSDTGEFIPVDSILADMRKASVIIVDVSLARPSVYFELGLAATTGRPVVVIAESGTVVHQTPSGFVENFFTDLKSYSNLLKELLSKHV